MYLSQIVFKPSRATRYWLTNPYEIHRRVYRALPDDRPLFRLEMTANGLDSLLVQSAGWPDWKTSFGDLGILRESACKSYTPRFQSDQVLMFRLRANPCKARASDGVREPLLSESEQLAWLERKLSDAAKPFEVQAGRYFRQRAWAAGKRITHHGVVFEGMLRVRDPDALFQAVRNGVGPAKGFGFGLLSAMPAY